MRLLITGGAGFIGSHLILHWLGERPEDQVLNIDKLTYAADLKYLDSVQDHPRYQFEKIDIAQKESIKRVIQDFQPEGVIHLAAESHVDNSISGPQVFVESNVVGTFNLIDECRKLWDSSRAKEENRFHHVSTDEIYGELGADGTFTEKTPMAPNSPYSATKAASDHLVHAYHRTYGMNAVITNCSNNFGPHQHDEKLIPTVIRSALHHKPIPVYGKGENIRDWLYVEEHCRALRLVFEKAKPGERYNIGSRNEWKNIDLVHQICDTLNEVVREGPNGDYKNLISFVTDRPGHDFRYSIDPSKLEDELGWTRSHDFSLDLKKTIQWYVDRYRSQAK